MKIVGKLLLLLLTCSLLGVQASAQDYDETAVLNFATNADPTLNPWTPGAVIESNLINTILFDQLTRYNPEDTLDVVFEDSSSFSLTGGYEFDSYFINQSLGLRYLYGATVGLNMYENVLNSGHDESLSRSFGGGVDLHLTAGIGYQFRPEIGALVVLDANGSWRDGIKKKLNSANQTIELPDNTFYAYALTGTVFWTF